jgi:multidrug transporter EmrE-like cation transporter
MDSIDLRLFSGLFERSGLPASWRFPIVSVTLMISLAGLDFVGSIFAKEWTERHHSVFFVAGLLTFVLLFVVYANSLKVVELSVVTIGWVVFLQVGLLVIDRLKYDVELSTAKWIAVGLILMLQAYLVLAPTADGR